jgi:hypothetical protein
VFEYLQWYEYRWYCQPALLGVRLPMILKCELLSFGYFQGGRFSFFLENSLLGVVQAVVAREPLPSGLWRGMILIMDTAEPVVREISFNRSLDLPELDPRVPVCGVASNGARWIVAHESRRVGLGDFASLFQGVSF